MAKVIAFSGIDGSGKSTQLKLVKNSLEQNNRVFVAKIAYSPLNDMGKNKLIDSVLKCRSGLEIIKYYKLLELNECKKYDYILCDRHLMCYLAYAHAYGVNNLNFIRKLLGFVKDPDLTLYFDINVNTALERINERGRKVDKNENFYTLSKAKEGYDDMFSIMDNIERINANKSESEIASNVNNVLHKRKMI